MNDHPDPTEIIAETDTCSVVDCGHVWCSTDLDGEGTEVTADCRHAENFVKILSVKT